MNDKQVDPGVLARLRVVDNPRKQQREYVDGLTGKVLASICLEVIQRNPEAESLFLRRALFPKVPPL